MRTVRRERQVLKERKALPALQDLLDRPGQQVQPEMSVLLA